MEHTNLKKQGMFSYFTGIVAIIVALLVLSFFVLGVMLHPESIKNTGNSFLVEDIVLVFLFIVASVWVIRQRIPKVSASLSVGAIVGIILGMTHIVHHIAEFFSSLGEERTALFVIGACHTLLILALLCVAGSIARERSGSIVLAVVAGLWSSILSVLILVAFGFSVNLFFESRAILHMHEAFQASGISDPRAFLVKNTMESASEAFLRLPILALILSFAGGLANAWVSHRERHTIIILAYLIPFVFIAGAILLWYANSLERAARPPFIMIGLLLAGVSLIGFHSVYFSRRYKNKDK